MAGRRKRARSAAKQSGAAERQSGASQRAHLRRLRVQQIEQQESESSREAMARRGIPMWGRTLIAVAVVLVLIVVLFRVREFEVGGNVRYSAEEIADASGVTKGDVLLGVNKTRAASRILVKLPYVQQVTVSRLLPGTVRFEVVECTAMAAAESEFGTRWLLNHDGKLLESTDSSAKSAYPVIQGAVLSLPNAGDQAVFQNETRGKTAMEIAQAVEAAELSGRVGVINVESLSQITLTVDDRVEVQLGDGTDVDYKLQYMLSALEKLDPDSRGVLDLSFSDGQRAIFHPLA